MVDEPFAFNGAQGGGAARGTDNQDSPLFLKYHPGKPSGPPYLIENLSGKCFSFLSGNYKYEFCPFHNVTQREQAYRWNAFNGILGIWKEWAIDGDNFTSMHYIHGDSCAGNRDRETTVKLKCGKESVIVSVSEPSMCKYELIFNTPYVCPEDVFFVYPMLSKEGRQRWREIENDHASGVTTEKGYLNNRRKLFISEGLIVAEDLRRKTGEAVGSNADHLQRPLENKPQALSSPNTSANNFLTLHQCDAEYKNLLGEVELLREQLRKATLANFQASFAVANEADSTLKPMAAVSRTNSFEEYNKTRDDEDAVAALGSKQKTREGQDAAHVPGSKLKTKEGEYAAIVPGGKVRGDLGVHDKKDTETVQPDLRKLSVDTSENIPIVANNNMKEKNKLLNKHRGDQGVLEEENFPSRNLMGRMEYQSNVISRMKIHGRLRDGQNKLNIL